jgi:small subunit ribosomal protein S15
MLESVLTSFHFDQPMRVLSLAVFVRACYARTFEEASDPLVALLLAYNPPSRRGEGSITRQSTQAFVPAARLKTPRMQDELPSFEPDEGENDYETMASDMMTDLDAMLGGMDDDDDEDFFYDPNMFRPEYIEPPKREGPSDAEIMRKEAVAQAEKYRRHENDTGSSAYQVAMLSAEIDFLTKHVQSGNRKDFSTIKGLKGKITRRRKLLEYLVNSNKREEFDALCDGLGIRKDPFEKMKERGARGRRMTEGLTII